MKYIPIAITLLLVTYGQLAIKQGTNTLGPIPAEIAGMAMYFLRALGNIWILSGLAAAGLGAMAWIAAMSKFELSSIYPILSLNFILVPLFSIMLFKEPFNLFKAAGVTLICIGVYVFSRGM